MDIEFYSCSNLGPRVQVHPVGESRTRQSERDSCDINLIMSQYVKTGYVDHLANHGANYGFADSISFHEAMNVVTKADQMFDALPAQARARFHGDPGEFLDFVQNEDNLDEMRTLGLARPGPAPEPGPVDPGGTAAGIEPVVPEPPAEPSEDG